MLSIRSLETLFPGRLLTGTLILISMQPRHCGSVLRGFGFLAVSFIYLSIGTVAMAERIELLKRDKSEKKKCCWIERKSTFKAD